MSCYVKFTLTLAQRPLADKDLVPTSASGVFQESCKKILTKQETSVSGLNFHFNSSSAQTAKKGIRYKFLENSASR